MTYSLLYRYPERENRSSAADDICLPDTISRICGQGADYFTSVVSAPLTDIGNIKYRREITADFENDPSLIEKLKKPLGRYDRMQRDWTEIRAGVSAGKPDRANAEASLAAAWESIRATAIFPGTLLSFIREIGEALNGANIASAGLSALRNRCAELSSEGLLTELVRIADRFRGTSPERNGLELNVSADLSLECASAEITDLFELSDKKSRGLRFRIKNKGPQTDGESEADLALLTAEAMCHLDAVLSDVTNRLYAEMYGLSRELEFYEYALKYVSFIKGKGCCVYPELARKGGASIAGLRDIRLLAVQDNVIPCDLRLVPEKAGILIKGENGAGKTTFLRAVCAAYLLCQAGLPIPADSAAMQPVSGIYTHFSSAEEDFTPGDRAGRFEGEVRAVADIMSSVEPGGLILMNETFQSTEFSEGTQAMHGILSVLPEEDIKYLLVTHLTDLFEADDLNADRIEFDIKKHDYKFLEERK